MGKRHPLKEILANRNPRFTQITRHICGSSGWLKTHNPQQSSVMGYVTGGRFQPQKSKRNGMTSNEKLWCEDFTVPRLLELWREHSTWRPILWRDTAVLSCGDTGWCGPGAAADWSTYLQSLLGTYLQQLQLMHPHKVIHLQEAATCIQTWERNKSGKMNSSQDAGRMVLTYWERNYKANGKIIMAKIQGPQLKKDIKRESLVVNNTTFNTLITVWGNHFTTELEETIAFKGKTTGAYW